MLPDSILIIEGAISSNDGAQWCFGVSAEGPGFVCAKLELLHAAASLEKLSC